MAPESLWGVIEEWPDIAEPLRSKLLSARDEIVRLRAENERLRGRIEAIGRELERARDVRVSRTRIIGNAQLIARRALAAAPEEATDGD